MSGFGVTLRSFCNIYISGQENSECTKCAIGKYQDGEGTNGCKSCPASEGKYTNAIGSIDCITVDIGYGVVSDTGGGSRILFFYKILIRLCHLSYHSSNQF